ncbi:DUF6090 family protein [Altibacter sp.]|uniref:DUF6090 family protein n=1 Tax=Altibacter sp. TaxID=2024823 RepID=UPI000C900243|nr:DUF6090 family protein [Altibacter sp.]MAP54469.1 hypothetical protein [Altibacter sp.]|tara:strand:+ start:532 stop:1311 length:780 start_codon:yes stop_codon:yes gene_type:complete
MINFIRKIRHRLLSENKFSKYLLYAIGEIILVVIGILIALQINNWNDRKKNAALELTYYNRILDDFDMDKQLIVQSLEKADKRINTSKELLLELHSGTESKNYLINKFLVAIRGDVFVVRDVTFKDLISSGNIKLLNDIAIKNSLIQYYSELENVQTQMKQNRDENLKNIFELFSGSVEFGGTQELQYVNQILGPEILKTLKQIDWTKDKDSKYYEKFQTELVFNISMADREKQHLMTIRNLMESPYALLVQKCRKDEN